MNNLIADCVTRRYGGVAVVSGASMVLEPGKVTALLGGSGAGKSTLLRLFAGLEKVDAGEIRLGDIILSTAQTTQPAEERRIGLVFQDFALFPHMTAQQNVQFGLKKLPKTERITLVEHWLSRLGLADRKSAYPHEMSGGEQQRVAIARALAPKPAAILLDEPFSGLDPALREDVREIALSAVRDAGIPALLVTHDASEAMAHADELAIMRAGEIVQQGKPQSVYQQPRTLAIASALGPVNLIPEASSLASILGANSAVREEGVRLDPDGPVRSEIISVRRIPNLYVVTLRVDGHGLLKAQMQTCTLREGDIAQIGFVPKLCFRF